MKTSLHFKAVTTVIVFENTITANSGPDFSICGEPVPEINLAGSVSGTTTGIWTGGAGTFLPDNTP